MLGSFVPPLDTLPPLLLRAACFLLEYERHDGASVLPKVEGVRDQIPVVVSLQSILQREAPRTFARQHRGQLLCGYQLDDQMAYEFPCHKSTPPPWSIYRCSQAQ